MDAYERLVARLEPDGRLAARRRLVGGVSAAVEALQIARPDGSTRAVVVRSPGSVPWKVVPREQAATEFALLRFLFDAGLPVPEPLLYDDAWLPAPCLVMSYVEGSAEIADVPPAMRAMADFLRALHQLDAGALPPVPRLEDPVPGALAALPDTPRRAPVRAALRPLRAHRDALVHGDFWPANVLWRGAEIAAVVDWEGAAVGDPAADVACCRVELTCSHGPDAADLFVARYAEGEALDEVALATWEIYASASALATMAEWGLPPEVEQRRRARTELALEAACARLLASPGSSR